MKEYKKYPIYAYMYKWIQNIDKENKNVNENFTKDLPEGKMYNSIYNTFISKEEISGKELNLKLSSFWDNYKEQKEKNNSFELVHCYMKIKEYSTWHMTWFCHETFRNGMTDQEALKSFEEYVSSKEDEIRRSELFHDLPTVTLMGAEDRWRWRGETHDDPAPCQCEHCKKLDMIRINH